MGKPGRRSTIYGDQNAAYATTADGRGLPVTVDNNRGLVDRAGVEPARLDDAIDSLIKVCEDGAALIDGAAPMLDAIMKRVRIESDKALARIESLSATIDEKEATEQQITVLPGINDMLARALDVASKVTTIMDRVNKMLVNAVKAKDTAIRLRTFIATGDQDQTGLDGMSENALRRIVNETAQGNSLPRDDFHGF